MMLAGIAIVGLLGSYIGEVFSKCRRSGIGFSTSIHESL